MKKKTKKTKRTKKKTTRKKKQPNYLKYFAVFLFVLVIALGGLLGTILYKHKQKEKELKEEIAKKEKALKILQTKVKTLQEEIKKTPASEIEDFIRAQKLVPPPTPKKRVIKTTKIEKNVTKKTQTKIAKKNIHKPKLVIIIDDMAYAYQVKLLKNIPYKITPSFFPASNRHPNTPKYAKEFSHYMIHLPLEALNYSHEEAKTLRITDSYSTISKRINEVKKEFPNAKFINNHTGSKFTGDYNAMTKLFKALKKDHLNFVDSKTTPLSKADKVNKIYHIQTYSRDIFLDNKPNPKYIRNQLKKAVEIAKKRGYAIAIGHPHKITLLTLKHSSDILKDVNVVYIDELK